MAFFRLGLAIGLLAATALPVSAYAAPTTAARWKPPRRAQPQPVRLARRCGNDPISIVVSLATQQAFVYRGQRLVAASTISSGRDGKDTPTGTFTILQKQAEHRSTLYNSAPMPFMSG